MSDDRRKNARLQGRFSNNPKESQHGDKKNSSKQNSGKNKGGNVKDQPPMPKGVDGINVEYKPDSTYTNPELSKKKAVEIRTSGFKLLSETRNGKSEVYYEPNFLMKKEADEYYTIYKESTPWEDKNIIINGQEYTQPRQVAWYGDLDYAYSGSVLKAAKMPDSIFQLKKRIEEYLKEKNLKAEFNSVLLNYYRNEKDSVAWHSDDELSMRVCPTIASISLGEIRDFYMRPKTHVTELEPNTQFFFSLLPGSLLVMTGCMQKDWQHQIPKACHNRKGRINLTFRFVSSYDKNDIPVPDPVNLYTKPTTPDVCQPSSLHNPDDFPSLGETIQVKTSASSKKTEAPKVPAHKEQGNTQTECNADSQGAWSDSGSLLKKRASSTGSTTIDTEDTKGHGQSNENAGENEACLPNEPVSLKASGYEEKNSFQNNESASDSKAHQFNVNAPDFIPSNSAFVPSFKQMSLNELASLGTDNFDSEAVVEFWYHLEAKLYSIVDPEKLFSYRDLEEIDTYSLLASNGLSLENQKLVNERVCKIVQSSFYKSKNYSRKPDVTRKPPRNMKGYRGRFQN